MKRLNQRILSIWLCFSLIIGIGYSEGSYGRTVKAQENNTQEEATTEYSYVWFGNYVQKKVTDEEELEVLSQYEFEDNSLYEQGCHYVYKPAGYYDGIYHKGAYFKDMPIQWRVLKDEGDSYLLLSEKILEWRSYHNWAVECWSDADIRKWLNSDFIEMAFAEEKNDLIESLVVSRDIDYSKIDLTGSSKEYVLTETRDRVWLLDEDEVMDSEYGFDGNTTRIAYTTSYVNENQPASIWFLRGHPYYYYGMAYAKAVQTNGAVQV